MEFCARGEIPVDSSHCYIDHRPYHHHSNVILLLFYSDVEEKPLETNGGVLGLKASSQTGNDIDSILTSRLGSDSDNGHQPNYHL